MTQWFVYIPAGFFFQVEFFEINFRWNFAVNPFRSIGKISTWKKIPGGKICIFRLILLLYIAFHLYSISCEGKKSTSIFFLIFHVFKFTWIPAGRFRTGWALNPPVNGKIQGFFKAVDCFSSTFQGKFNFQGLFKTALYIQVIFKPVRTLQMDGSMDRQTEGRDRQTGRGQAGPCIRTNKFM